MLGRVCLPSYGYGCDLPPTYLICSEWMSRYRAEGPQDYRGSTLGNSASIAPRLLVTMAPTERGGYLDSDKVSR